MINQEKQSFSLSDNAMTCNVETSVYKLFLIQEFPSNKKEVLRKQKQKLRRWSVAGAFIGV